MKAISLWQPWASLWLSDRKIHETRHWATPHRGRLLVHAAKKLDIDIGAALRGIVEDEYGGHWAMDLPRGAIIGWVELLDCVPTETFPIGHSNTDDYECGNFAAKRFGWKRGAFETFKTPIPYRGQQSIFDVPGEFVGDGFNVWPKPASAQEALQL